jgi:hypothetical protein
MIAAMNAQATVEGLIEKNEDFLYDVDQIATEVAYEAGWTCDDQGVWTDETGDEVDDPLGMLYQYNLPTAMQNEIVERCLAAYAEEVS